MESVPLGWLSLENGKGGRGQPHGVSPTPAGENAAIQGGGWN